MSRRQAPRRRSHSRRPARRSQRSAPSFFWGRTLLTAVILMIIWAQWKGQQ